MISFGSLFKSDLLSWHPPWPAYLKSQSTFQPSIPSHSADSFYPQHVSSPKTLHVSHLLIVCKDPRWQTFLLQSPAGSMAHITGPDMEDAWRICLADGLLLSIQMWGMELAMGELHSPDDQAQDPVLFHLQLRQLLCPQQIPKVSCEDWRHSRNSPGGIWRH